MSHFLPFSLSLRCNAGWTPLAAATVGLLLVMPAHAQQAVSATGGSTTVNGFAEQQIGRAPRAVATLDNRLYAPIQKPTDEGQIPEIEMFVGESRVFPAPGVARIAVGNGAILNAAALDDKEIILFANGPGTSSLFVWNEDGRHQRVKINIVPGDTGRFAREIAAFLTTIPRARAAVIGDKVIVEGDNLSDADLARIDLLSKRYPQIVNFTNPLGFETMVMLDVKVVEFPTAELRELGLKWNASGGTAIGAIWSPIRRGSQGPYQISIQGTGGENAPPITAPGGGQVVLPSGLNVLSVLNLGLNATLSALAQEGRTTILAQPQLSARNGSKASFLVGGQIPYAVVTSEGTQVAFKDYGVKLDILPRVDGSGNVRSSITTEVSNIDQSVSTPFGPALLTRRTETEFNVRSGETIVLSGLIQRESSVNVDKVPGLGDIPVLGALFRSRKFQNRETELVVFVTPTVVDPSSPGVAGRVQRNQERLTERLGPAPHITDPLQPGRDYGRPDLPDAHTLVPGPLSSPSEPEDARQPVSTPALTSQNSSVQALPEDRVGMVRSDWQAVPFDPPQGSTLRSRVHGLVVRSHPSQAAEPLLQVGRHAVLTLRDVADLPSHAADWLPVQTGQVSGWVARHLVEPAKLTLSTQPHQTQISSGSTVGRAAFPSASTRNLTLNDLPLRGQYTVVAKRLPLLLTPDINAPAVLFLAEGQIVNQLSIEPRGAWTAVEVNGQRGWLATPWLQPVLPQTGSFN